MKSLPIEQQAIREKCFHPTGTFVEFTKAEVEQSIPARFEEIVRRDPHHLAVATAEVELTYDQLNRMTNRMARAILRHDQRAPGPVALLFDSDASVFAAPLGVLKAGSFFVLLDPTVPASRLQYILEDSGATLIAADRRMIPLATEVAGGRELLDFDAVEDGVPDDNLGRVIVADAVAAIVYTSGSTGAPKGIIQTHRNYLHSGLGEHNRVRLCPEDRLVRPGSLSTGGGLLNIMKLLSGISFHPFDVRQQGVSKLAGWLKSQRITNLIIGAPIFRAFIATLRGDEKFPNVRAIHLTSDRGTQQDVDAYKQHFSDDCILISGLATSETHPITDFFMDKSSVIEGNIIPVGYPMEDQNVILLDDEGNEVPDGGVGQIAVKSRYLSPGYCQRPELTRAKFIPDANGDEVLFMTGDLGRISDDGCLSHLGRKDLRVKVRGFSVEVGEVELALLEHSGVKEAVVKGVEDPTGERRLVAYVVFGDSTATTGKLRSFLRERLPDYMIPTAFVVMDALPLNSAGKVDRVVVRPDGG